MAIGKPPPSALPARNWRSADRTIAAGKHGHLGEPRQKSRALAWLFLGLVTPPQPFAEAERKASPNVPEHNTVPGGLPTALMAGRRPVRGTGRTYGFGVSSRKRPAPPWPSGFSSSGRMVLSSPCNVHGGLTINRPVETSGPVACCGATENSSRRHLPAGLAPSAACATSRARVSAARRLLTGYQSR